MGTTTPSEGRTVPTDKTARNRIITSGLKRFSTHGYHGVSMSDIAQDAGVTKAALYYHFTDKEALFLEVLKSRTEQLAADLDQMIDDDEPLEPMLKRIATFLLDDGLTDYRQLQTDLLNVVGPERRAEHLANTRGVISRLLPHFEAEQRDGRIAPDVELDIALPLFFSMVSGQIRRHALGLGRDPLPHTNTEIADVIVRVWLHGITTPEQGETA